MNDEFPNNDKPCYSYKGEYLGYGYIDGEWLNILDNEGNAEYQIPVANIYECINAHNPKPDDMYLHLGKPNNWYQEFSAGMDSSVQTPGFGGKTFR